MRSMTAVFFLLFAAWEKALDSVKDAPLAVGGDRARGNPDGGSLLRQGGAK